MPKYRYVGDHADFVQKGDKTVPVAPGDFIELTEAEANAVEPDLLIPATEPKGGKSA